MPYYRESKYKKIYEDLQIRKNEAYNTKGKITFNTMSRYLFGNSNIRKYLEKIEPAVEEMVKLPRKIRIFSSWAVEKDDKFIY